MRKDYWVIDYKKSVGQKDAKMLPKLFRTRKEAIGFNATSCPTGIVKKVELKVWELPK